MWYPHLRESAYELGLKELMKPGSLAPDVAGGPQKALTEVKGIKWSRVGGASAKARGRFLRRRENEEAR